MLATDKVIRFTVTPDGVITGQREYRAQHCRFCHSVHYNENFCSKDCFDRMNRLKKSWGEQQFKKI